MTIWLAATFGLLPPFIVAVGMAARGPVGGRLVAIQFGTSVASFVLIALSFLFDQPSSIDLALTLTLTLLTLPGTLLFCLFEERWL